MISNGFEQSVLAPHQLLCLWPLQFHSRMLIMLLEDQICTPSELLYRSTAVRPRPSCSAMPGRLQSPPARWSAASRTFGDLFPLRFLQHVLAFCHWVSFCQPKLGRLQVWRPLTSFFQPVQPQVGYIYEQMERPHFTFALQTLPIHQHRLPFAAQATKCCVLSLP